MPEEIRIWQVENDEDYSGYEGFYFSDGEIENFLNGLQNVVKH